MSYSRPPAKTAGDVFDLTAYNAIRDSLIAGVPDLYTAKGDLAPATGSDAAQRLAVGSDHALLVADSAEAVGMRWQVQPICILTNSAAFDPTPDTWVSVTWDTENQDPASMHSTVTNPERVTVQSGGAGFYLAGVNIGFDTSTLTPGTSGQYGVRIRHNGTTVLANWFDEAEMQSQDAWAFLMRLADLSVADYLEAQVWTSQDVDILAASTFWVTYQRTT